MCGSGVFPQAGGPRGSAAAAAADATPERIYSRALAEMPRHQLRHLKHIDLTLAAKDDLELRVSVDVALVLLILQTVGFDVLPQLFHDLPPRHRTFANDRLKVCRKIHRLE